MANPYRYDALRWLSGELEQNLNRARAAIEQAFENPAGDTPLQQAAAELQQVRGTAAMIRCGGAALLAGEMLASLQDLRGRQAGSADELYGALLGGLVQLSDYLQALAEQMDDCALLLQPAINELRLARGQAVLTESEIFAAQLALIDPPLAPLEAPPEAGLLAAQARRYAPAFQASLLSWIRNAADAQAAAARLGKIAEHLATQAARAESHQLLRIAAAAIEGLLSRGLDNSMDLKRAFGRLDQQIRLFGEQGEDAGAAAAAELAVQLLFLIGRSTARGPRVSALRAQYELDALLPDGDELEARRRRIHGPNARLLSRVADEIRQDFLRVKDQIDLAVRAGGASVDQFAAARADLHRLADVLGSLGLATLQQTVENQARTLEQLGGAAGSEQWLALAESILRVESSLDDALFRQLRPATAAQRPELSDETPTRRDLAESLEALARESLVNLALVKGIAGDFLRDGSTTQLPDAVLLVDELGAGCEMVDRHRVGDAVRRLQRFIAGPAFAQIRCSPELAERFADAIAALEYYLEAERDRSPLAELLSSRIEAAVAAIDATAEVVAAAAPEPCETADAAEAPPPPASAEFVPPAVTGPAAGEDDEIREVFLEEAAQVLATLRETLPAWTREPRDRERMTTVRRAFHTLKGSGRTVGASALGEFAWAIEQLLNGALDDVVPLRPGIVDLVNAAVECLPAQIDAFRNGHPLSEPAQQLMLRAQRYAAGEDPDAASPQDIAAVFRDDARDKLAGVQRWLDGADSECSRHRVNDDAIRAFHTLRGAARVVDAPAIGELAAALELWLERVAAAGEALDDAALTLLDAATHTLKGWCAQAGSPAAAQQDARLWIEQIQSLQGSLAALQVDDEARRLLDVFCNEAFELLQKAEALLRAWAQAPDDQARCEELRDICRTLAGAAQMSSCAALGEAAAAMLGRVEEALARRSAPTPAAFAALHGICEGFYQQLDLYREGRLHGGCEELLALIAALDWHACAPQPGPPLSSPLELLPTLTPQAHGLDAELLDVFVAEAEELLEAYERGLEGLEANGNDSAVLNGLMRTLHTFKGSARVAGAATLGDAAHRLESLLESSARQRLVADVALLRSAGIVLRGALDDLRQGLLPDLRPLLAALGEAPVPAASADAAPPAASAAAEPAVAAQPEEQSADDGGAEAAEAATPAVAMGSPALQSVPAEIAPASSWQLPAASRALPLQPNAPLLRLDELPQATGDFDVVQIFGAEARELIEQIEQAYARWQVLPDQGGPAQELQRALHTLKGSARAAGLLAVGDAAHELETRVAALQASGGVSRAQLEPLAAALTTLRTMLDRLQRGDLSGLLERRAAPMVAAPVSAGAWDPELFWRPDDEDEARVGLQRESARVPVELLDGMLNEAGEIAIHRARLEEQQNSTQAQLGEMVQAVQRIREQLRQLDIETEAQIAARGRTQSPGADRYAGEFDPLELDRYTRMQELSRALAESVGDLGTIHAALDGLGQQSMALLQQQARVNVAMQQKLMGTLMVPFARQAARLQRVAMQTATEVHKQVEIVFSGAEAELDRKVLERLTAPLEHLIRNAVVHGMETPSQRLARGKPGKGEIQVRLWREGTQLRVELRDDGAGLDFAAIRDVAIRRGLPAGPAMADEALLPLIFMPGFSTARELTQSAGRGVGLDVVAAEVKQLGGSVEVVSDVGGGTRFIIRIPLNLALSQALLVVVGGETYAVPLASVDGIARLPRAQIAADEAYRYGGADYRLRYLGDYIGSEAQLPADARMLHALLVRRADVVGGGERRYAVVVDRLLGSREVVSKAVGAQISSVPGVLGATIAADGSAVLIVDIAALVDQQTPRCRTVPEPAGDAASPRQIMVVDDSLTIRRVTERLLQRHGYAVVTARDGLDAMAQLQSLSPAAVLLDIEMPRADGFEVAAYIRHTARIARTPIVMITSRSGDKHRERAAALGVDRYLIKPYQEDQLLAELRGVLRHTSENA